PRSIENGRLSSALGTGSSGSALTSNVTTLPAFAQSAAIAPRPISRRSSWVSTLARACPPLEAPSLDSFLAVLLLMAESVITVSYMLRASMSILAPRKKIFVDYLPRASIEWTMKQKAPISVEAPTGAEIRTAEAERTVQPHYRPSSVRSQGDFTDDLP